MPGLGQLYNGDWLKGVGLLAASMLLGGRLGDVYPLASMAGGELPKSPLRFALYAIGLTVVWLWGVHDARRCAR